MILTGIARRISSLVAAVLASACCTSLPRAPAKGLTPLPVEAAGGAVSASEAVWHDARRQRDVPVKFYEPDGNHPPLPVVLFSHGIGEDRYAYEYFGRALAGAGFLAVHVTHGGTDRAVLERGYLHLYRAVKQRENWVNRPLDLSFVLDRLESDPRGDTSRVAVAGHSAGAFTAFAVAGLRMREEDGRLRDPRVKVIVPMSMPRLNQAVAAGGYDGIGIPVLNVTGTCDASLIYRTLPKHRRIPFDETRAAGHYLLTIEGINHDTFSRVSDRYHPLLTSITIAFLRGFLLKDPAAKAWFEDSGRGTAGGTEIVLERK